jgi:hypothetical protein
MLEDDGKGAYVPAGYGYARAAPRKGTGWTTGKKLAAVAAAIVGPLHVHVVLSVGARRSPLSLQLSHWLLVFQLELSSRATLHPTLPKPREPPHRPQQARASAK